MATASMSNGGAGLTVLTVRLMFRHSGAAVNLTLSAGDANGQVPNGSDDTSWDVPFHSFNPSDDGVNLVIPRGLADDVKFRLAGLERGRPGDTTLWLKLARPYGMLGTAPWERDIGGALDRAVLRLPDYPERPAERPGVLENAVLVDPAGDAPDRDVVPRVQALVRAILDGSGRPATRLHIFPNCAWYARLQPLADGTRVQVHDPAGAQTSAEATQASGTAPAQILRAVAWSNWIAKVMDGRGLDAVHLFCRARAQAEQTGGDLVLSSSPSPNESPAVLTVIDQDEICLLLNRAGAWAVTFVPVAIDQPRLVAFVADCIAHRRPGASLFLSLAEPSGDAALAAACRLLFAEAAAPAPAPKLRDGFLFCHPSFLRGSQALAEGGALGELADSAAWQQALPPLIAATGGGTGGGSPVAATAPADAPNWLGSTQRFLESAVFDEVRRAAPDVLLSTSPKGTVGAPAGALSTGSAASTALADIQNVVAGYLRTHQGSN
jgi:hypothetical protein